ncbi:MAG: hypothetical protein PHH11_08410 [Methylomonas sp.]|nr:hypothetical protein [Methylomonas sp.]
MFRNLSIALLTLLAASSTTRGDEHTLKTFATGSYQQILSENIEKPFVLAIWSIDCPSCLKDMDVLYQLHQRHPQLTMIMLSTDEPGASDQVNTILTQHKLDNLQNWIFGNDDAQKLRYEIDPGWYGELPRTYFFSSSHQRSGKSGALKLEELETRIADIIP